MEDRNMTTLTQQVSGIGTPKHGALGDFDLVGRLEDILRKDILKRNPAELMMQAEGFMGARDYEEAAKCAALARNLTPEDPAANYLLGNAILHLAREYIPAKGRSSKASEDIKEMLACGKEVSLKAKTLAPENPEYFMLYLEICALAGDYGAIARQANLVLKNMPESLTTLQKARVHELFGKAKLYARHEAGEASIHFYEANKLDSDNPRYWIDLAEVEAAKDISTGVAAMLQRALDFIPVTGSAQYDPKRILKLKEAEAALQGVKPEYFKVFKKTGQYRTLLREINDINP